MFVSRGGVIWPVNGNITYTNGRNGRRGEIECCCAILRVCEVLLKLGVFDETYNFECNCLFIRKGWFGSEGCNGG